MPKHAMPSSAHLTTKASAPAGSKISAWQSVRWWLTAGAVAFLLSTQTAKAGEYVTSNMAVGCVLPGSVDKAMILITQNGGKTDSLEAIGCVKLKKGLRVILLKAWPKGAYEVLLYGGTKPTTVYLSGASFADPTTGATVWDVR